MIINRVALQRQSTVLLALAVIIMVGVFSYLSLPRESFPEINIPYVFVTTSYEGVSATDIETLITMPIERKLKGLDNVKNIRSTSNEGISTVAIQFSTSADIEKALQEVKDKVDLAKNDLPQDLPRSPSVMEVNFSDIPVVRIILSGPFSLQRLKSIADDMKTKLEAIPGVLEARLTGGLDREIYVEFDMDRTAAYNVPFSSLIAAVQRSNVNMPGGSMDIGDFNYTLRIPEEFKHPAEIFSIVAFAREGKPIYLRDLATVKDGYRNPLTRSRLDGQNSVNLDIQKRTGENIVQISDAVRETVEEMKLNLPPSLEINLTSDQADEVRLMISELENNILSGLILVLVVIFLFIGGRSAIFVALAIPYSMFITFGLLTAMDVSLNIVVLFALILSLGMLVDNAIVIVENIYRHIQEGKSRSEAAVAATDEVAWPVITSTLTTLGAFVPLLFWQSIMGQFIRFLPITLIMALSSSLIVALVINPVLSARYQKVKIKKANPGKKNKNKEPLIKRFYLVLLKFSLNHRLTIILISFLILIGTVASFFTFGKGIEFFPGIESRRAYIFLKSPEGTNLNATDRLTAQVEEMVTGYEDIRHYISNVGSGGGNIFSAGGGSGTHISNIVLEFMDYHERSRPSSETVNEIRTKLKSKIKGAEVRVEEESMGPPTGAAVNLEIAGADFAVLGDLAAKIRQEIENIPGLVDLKDDFVKGKPEIRINVDKEKAAILGLDTYTIAYTIKGAIQGVQVGNYREGKDEYPIIARLPDKDRRSIESLKRLTISGRTGQPVPLTSVAEISLTRGYGAINRLNQRRVITISGNVSGRIANAVNADIKERLADFDWPRGYSYAATGEMMEMKEVQSFLSKAFLAAVVIIFIILVTQFNSLATPMIIITSVLLSFIGVFAGLLLTNRPFNIMMTGVGMISLAGVVVNNAIVLIDYYKKLMAQGLSSREALEKAGLTRFRPVMLTAITTILGLLPMATGISINFRERALEVGGEMSQMWNHMAIAVIFGLTVATLMTLIVVPVLCSLTDSFESRFRRASV
ncbi:MAG: efflux RND transporter permease subunit [Candidatus Adiutricales bacterium]